MADVESKLSTASGPTARSAAFRLRVRYRLTPMWGRVLAIFVASRVVTTFIMLAFAAAQPEVPGWVGATPDYFNFATIWDGRWYWVINGSGYPSELPVDDSGNVGENAWAFMPAYPFLLRIFTVIGIPFPVIAPLVSTAFAFGAALLFYRMMSRFLPSGSALFAVALFCFAPLSPILQVAYAESMHLFLLFAALVLLLERRYWLMIPVVVLMSLTRPSGLAFALCLLLHAIHRFVVRRREPFPLKDRVAVVVAGLISALAGVAWPLIAWAVTGSATAYTDTELVWRAGYIGRRELIPFQSWPQGAEFWLHFIGVPDPVDLVLGTTLVVILAAGFGVFLFTPWARRLGVDLRFWLASYAIYLLAVFFPQSSTFRLLMPLAPALGALAVPRSRVFRAVLIVLGVAGQVGWVCIAWWISGVDWSPP
jgi:hypothetical protein